MPSRVLVRCSFVFFNDTATTEIYTLSLHDALPISPGLLHRERDRTCFGDAAGGACYCQGVAARRSTEIARATSATAPRAASSSAASHGASCKRHQKRDHPEQVTPAPPPRRDAEE